MSAMNEDLGALIVAALGNHGPCSPADLARNCDVERPEISKALAPLIKAKVVEATGATVNRMIALPGTGGAAATVDKKPPKVDKAERKTKPAPTKSNGEASKFLAAMTAELGLVIIEASETHIFSPEETQVIADIILVNFEAA